MVASDEWTSKAQEGFNAWNRPPLQTQHNMEEEEDVISPNRNGVVKQCVKVNEDSYTSDDSSSSEDDQSEEKSISIAQKDYNPKPPNEVILPNFVTIGRTTSLGGNPNSSSVETKGTITWKNTDKLT